MLIAVLIVLLVVVFVLIAANIRIVPQAHAFVIEHLGKYKTTWQAGLHVKTPFIERVIRNISLKEQVLDFPPQPVITKDNVTMQIDSVVFMKIFDPKLYTYGVDNPIAGLQNLSATTLRNIIGDMELDETLTSREIINSKMQTTLDEATDPWGIKVTRVESAGSTGTSGGGRFAGGRRQAGEDPCRGSRKRRADRACGRPRQID